LTVEDSGDHGRERLRIDELQAVVIHPTRKTTLLIALHDRGSERNDGQMSAVLAFLPRYVSIKQHQRKSLVYSFRVFQEIQCGFPAFDDSGPHPPMGAHVEQQAPIGGVIVDHQERGIRPQIPTRIGKTKKPRGRPIKKDVPRFQAERTLAWFQRKYRRLVVH
jgi:hypothetical protein